jgi:hypothetical protein
MTEWIILAVIAGFLFHKLSKLTVIHLEFEKNDQGRKTGERKQLKK